MREYINIPFEEHGRGWDGCDCWGLVVLFYRDMGVDLPEFVGQYQSTTDRENIEKLTSQERETWERVEEPKVGDVVLVNIYKQPVHTGIYIGGNKMLHVMRGRQSCVENLNDPEWRNRIEGFYRYNASS